MAQPSIRAGIIIEDSQLVDTYDEFGFIYISSDNRVAAPEKKREVTTYAEQEGENVDPRTIDDVFDYKVKFLIETPNTNRESANAKIKRFNDAIRSVDPITGIKTCRRITLYNYYKRVAICGIPEIIAEPSDFYRRLKGDALDCVQVELTIHVDIPSLCDFNLSLEPTLVLDYTPKAPQKTIEIVDSHLRLSGREHRVVINGEVFDEVKFSYEGDSIFSYEKDGFKITYTNEDDIIEIEYKEDIRNVKIYTY